ncbi:hypothetical protein ACHHV8_21175 [Paenibacillus sp. TAB 01]|uniref:hypothetical protein n=1 Tax=Paenibacillus sp. TAB 01 TaxID=3368988 RepID=UPI0037510A9D
MISNREIKGQIDELTEQNQFLTQELQQIKELIQNQGKNQSQGQSQSQGQGQDQGQGQGQDQRQAQTDQSQGEDSGQQGQGGAQGADSFGGSQQKQGGGGSNNQIFDIANDFLKLKELTSSLEKKMQEYTSSKSSGGSSLTDEDVINLVLSMMNGMIDWTMDFASRPKQGQGSQSQQLQ